MVKLLIQRVDGSRLKVSLSELESSHINGFLYQGKGKWAKFKVKLLK